MSTNEAVIAEVRSKNPENFALANCIRALAMDGVQSANSGHPGAPMGMADAATVLFTKHLKFDPSNPRWPDRDRFVLSNGHASMMLYSLLHLVGYEDMSINELKNFRQWGSKTAGHPETGHAGGIETTTGPLGQGLASAVGMALAEEIMADKFGSDLVDHHTYVFVGDGCLQEGIGQEASSLAGHLKLGKLIVLYDNNSITIDGPTEISFSENIPARFEACGWNVISADGHDPVATDLAISTAKSNDDRPTLIDLKTIIGFGSPAKSGKASSHGAPLGADEITATKRALGWDAEPFSIPRELIEKWRQYGARSQGTRTKWEDNFKTKGKEQQSEFNRRINGKLPGNIDDAILAARDSLFNTPQNVATRKASQIALETLTAAVPEMIGGSADLTGSNLTRVPAVDTLFKAGSPGRYIGYGVREFAMAAAMNGMSVHGGVIPYGGTFLVFSDYARNAIRLSALMGVGTIYVMTHDSIGLGEDGPTHQPIEHLASLRAIPNLNVFRPADAVETLECWEIALRSRSRPSVMVLSRQSVPQLRGGGMQKMSIHGAYVMRSYGDKAREVTLLATGTEVSLAIEAAEELSADGINLAVVSMPSWELFEAQPEEYRTRTLGKAPRLAIEAASPFGWTRYVGSEDDVIGMKSFGASAPAEVLYEKFGITKQAIVGRAKALAKR